MDEDALRNMTAQEYAKACNAERREQAQAEGWSGFSLHPEDDAFWQEQARLGVCTGLDLVRRDLVETYSDLYKEAYGIRPRTNLNGLSLEELQGRIDAL